MQLRLMIIIFGLVFTVLFIMGAAVGYYAALFQLKQTELLALGAFAFAFLTWFGSGTSMIGLLRDWYKDKREQESKPTLEYGDVVVTKIPTKTHNEEYDTLNYFLNIIMSSGEGVATDCHAFLSVPKLGIEHWPLFWGDGPAQIVSIGDKEKLHLFTVYDYHRYKSLLWHNPTMNYLKKDDRRYEDIIDSELEVKLVTMARKPKEPFTKKYVK
jgi:hypothetical protein